MSNELLTVDCQGFAGGFTLGMVRAGFTLVGKKEMRGGFGVPNCEANRHLLGDGWQADVGDPDTWEPIPAHVVFGNPPCSGFSLLSAKHFRGPDSPVNSCMWAFESFAARTLPYIAVFESVQQAYSAGADLMRALHAQLEDDTSVQWNLHHVLHNAASIGGAAIRKRYFWLVSRIPFGIEPPEIDRVPTVRDVIGDLYGLGQTWEAQPYRRPVSWWVKRHHLHNGSDVVDGVVPRNTPHIRRALALMEDWAPGEIISTVARRRYERTGTLPDPWPQAMVEKLAGNDWRMGYNQQHRIREERVCRVMTGGALDHVIHPVEDRFLTHREVSRIQGFPDDWVLRPLRGKPGLHTTYGKGIPVQAGQWIGGWIRQALLGTPGSITGEPIGDREFKIDCTNDYRRVCAER